MEQEIPVMSAETSSALERARLRLDKIMKVRQLRRAYRIIGETAEGKQVLKDLKKFCLYEQELFVPGDAAYTAYNAGKRRVFLRFVKMASMSEDKIDLLSQEDTLYDD